MIDFIHIAKAAAETAVAGESSGGVIDSLGLNWKLFIAQLINFSVILFVLWKWVFTPVAKKLTERTEKIEKSLFDADQIAKEKQEFETWKNAEISKTRAEAMGIITQGQSEAVKVKDDILSQAKTEQQKLVEQAKNQILAEKSKSLSEAKTELADLITSATEKILREKLDEKKDKELIRESLKNI
jgi:F-type H+-transporting ATPase subunit b